MAFLASPFPHHAPVACGRLSGSHRDASLTRTYLRASAEEDPGTSEADGPKQAEGAEDKRAQKPLFPELFPIGRVKAGSNVQGVARFIEGSFVNDTSLKALDIIRFGSTDGGVLLLALSKVSPDLQVVAQVLPRQRDSRFRVRLLRNLPVTVDDGTQLFTASQKTDPKKLASALLAAIRPPRDSASPPQYMVQIKLLGYKAAENVIKALEDLFWRARREISFAVLPQARSVPAEGGTDSPKERWEELLVTVISS